MSNKRVSRRGWVNALSSPKLLFFRHSRVRTAHLEIVKLDNSSSVGSIAVASSIIPDYEYHNLLLSSYPGMVANSLVANELPTYYFEFASPDAGSTAHEAITGNALTVNMGAGLGVIPATEGISQLQGYHGMLDPRSSAFLSGSSAPLAVQDNSSLAWGVAFWLYWIGGNNSIYVETVANLSQQIGVAINNTGHIYFVNGAGGIVWTSGYASAANTWLHHLVTAQTPGGGITHIVNGVVQSGPTGYVHGSTFPNLSYLNFTAANQIFLSNLAVWQRFVSVNEGLGMYNAMTLPSWNGSNFTTPATMAQNNTGIVLFTDSAAPGLVSGTFNIVAPLVPLPYVTFTSGLYQWQYSALYED